jgi:hypothetical protein
MSMPLGGGRPFPESVRLGLQHSMYLTDLVLSLLNCTARALARRFVIAFNTMGSAALMAHLCLWIVSRTHGDGSHPSTLRLGLQLVWRSAWDHL